MAKKLYFVQICLIWNLFYFLQLLWICYKRLKLNNDEVLENKELQEKLKNYLIKNGNNFINKIYGMLILLIPFSENAKNFLCDQLNNYL